MASENPADAPTALLMLQTLGSGMAAVYAAKLQYVLMAVFLAAFFGWSVWLVGCRLLHHDKN